MAVEHRHKLVAVVVVVEGVVEYKLELGLGIFSYNDGDTLGVVVVLVELGILLVLQVLVVLDALELLDLLEVLADLLVLHLLVLP